MDEMLAVPEGRESGGIAEGACGEDRWYSFESRHPPPGVTEAHTEDVPETSVCVRVTKGSTGKTASSRRTSMGVLLARTSSTRASGL